MIYVMTSLKERITLHLFFIRKKYQNETEVAKVHVILPHTTFSKRRGMSKLLMPFDKNLNPKLLAVVGAE